MNVEREKKIPLKSVLSPAHYKRNRQVRFLSLFVHNWLTIPHIVFLCYLQLLTLHGDRIRRAKLTKMLERTHHLALNLVGEDVSRLAWLRCNLSYFL